MNALAATAHDDAEGRILDALLSRGRLKDADLARARPLHAEAGGSLLALLVRLGLVSERDQAQASADVLGLPVERPAVLETTALGAALLAGIETGFFADASAIDGARRVERVFEPSMPAADRRRLLDRWHDAVERSKGWAR